MHRKQPGRSCGTSIPCERPALRVHSSCQVKEWPPSFLGDLVLRYFCHCSQTRGRSRSHSASARDDRHSYIPRTWSDETVRTNGIAAALPPTLSSKIGSMRKPKPVIADNIGVFHFCICASGLPICDLLTRKISCRSFECPFGAIDQAGRRCGAEAETRR